MILHQHERLQSARAHTRTLVLGAFLPAEEADYARVREVGDVVCGAKQEGVERCMHAALSLAHEHLKRSTLENSSMSTSASLPCTAGGE